MNFWRTNLIRLRGIEPSDAPVFFEWNKDSERAQYLDFTWPPTSLASVEEWVKQQSQKSLEGDAFHWVIENSAGQPVGSIGTHACNPHTGTFSYALDIARAHRRQGYARAAILLILRYYFDELRYQKVTVPVHSNNEPSLSLHKKLGLQQEGCHRRMGFSQGRYFDVIWFGMTVDEYRISGHAVGEQ